MCSVMSPRNYSTMSHAPHTTLDLNLGHGCGWNDTPMCVLEPLNTRMDENPRLVFDLGSHSIKAGFAGADEPAAIVPSVVGRARFDKVSLPGAVSCKVVQKM